ncbi:MAG: 30S ribosomal protein S5 alanine N-acetyltransferase [Rhodospirillaceae bacterium]|nr:30S ribosomal protein S5 alanine N-acetyltransferase [Rhodospirillaceae bacterium]
MARRRGRADVSHSEEAVINLLKSLSEIMRGRAIGGPTVYLRQPHRRDWRSWVALRSRSHAFLKPWEPTWPKDALTRKAFLRRLRAHALQSHSDAGYAFFVFRRNDDALLGGITVSNVRRGIAQSCSVGYWIGEPYARRGYMTEALASLLPFIFENLRLHRIEAAVLPENAASRALLKKVGFREEGYARQFLRINGEWQDHVLFGMLAGDPRPVVHTVIEGGRELRPAVAPSGAFAVSSVAAPSQNTVGGRNSSTA